MRSRSPHTCVQQPRRPEAVKQQVAAENVNSVSEVNSNLLAAKEKPMTGPPQLPRRDDRIVATPQRSDGLLHESGFGIARTPRERLAERPHNDAQGAVAKAAKDSTAVNHEAPICQFAKANTDMVDLSVAPKPPGGDAPQRRRPRARSPCPPSVATQRQLVKIDGALVCAFEVNVVAESWLRFARVALLMLPNERSKQEPDLCEQGIVGIPDANRLMDKLDESATRVSGEADVDGVVASDVVADEDHALEKGFEEVSSCGRLPPRYRNGNLCLGDMMDESITWLEPSTDSEMGSPKRDQTADVDVPEEDDSDSDGEQFRKQGLKAIARQQNAPGILSGMPKCLSFL